MDKKSVSPEAESPEPLLPPKDVAPLPIQEESTMEGKAGAHAGQSLLLPLGLILGFVFLLLLFLIILLAKGRGGNELGLIKEDLENERQALLIERGKLGVSERESPASLQFLAQEISTQALALSHLAEGVHEKLEVALVEKQNAEATTRALSSSLTDLQMQMKEFKPMVGEADRLRGELQAKQALIEQANERIKKLKEEMAARPAEAELLQLQASYEEVSKENQALHASLEELKQKVKSAESEDGVNEELIDLHTQIVVKDDKIKSLQYKVQELRLELSREQLLAKTSDDLLPVVKKLFDELAKVEGTPAEKLAEKYGELGKSLQAKKLGEISFATDSFHLNAKNVKSLRKSLANTGKDSIILVAGYASRSGDGEYNKKLSNNRAANVAAEINVSKKESQQVQAVFLGQTSRYSEKEEVPNQVCEIWEINPS